MVTLPIATELLQSVARRDSQVVQGFRRIDRHQLPEHDAPKVRWEPPYRLPTKEALSIAIAEGLDHRL